jgi:hypothetical protein
MKTHCHLSSSHHQFVVVVFRVSGFGMVEKKETRDCMFGYRYEVRQYRYSLSLLSTGTKREDLLQVLQSAICMHYIPMTENQNNEEVKGQQRQSSSINYYQFFDQKTNHGKVFDEYLSAQHVGKKSLTASEKKARSLYQETIETLHGYYRGKNHPVATTKEEVLQQRVVAPCLGIGRVSSRSATNERRSHRVYPTNFHPWTDFQEQVENFKVNGSATEELDQIFYTSLKNAKTKLTNEAGEQHSLTLNLGMTLEAAGIVHSIVDEYDNVKGDPDFIIKSEDKKISIICECKATHNLLLPMTAVKCKEAYDTAYANTTGSTELKKLWSNVAHPIGQLLWYLIDNKHCYGALTSGTRTYFVKIEVPDHTISNDSFDGERKASAVDHIASRNPAEKKMKMGKATGVPFSRDKGDFQNYDNDDGIRVYISDAWFVGQANYLRAWAYVHNLRESMQPFKITPGWLESTPEQRGAKPSGRNNLKDNASSGNNNVKYGPSSSNDGSPPSRNEYGGQFANTCNIEYYHPIHRGAIAFAPYDDIVTVGVLGQGRNGGCFHVKWKGTEYAMKQFDIGKHGDKLFMKEIRAYMLLKDVWGILVPRPIFLSESYSGNIMFLGLQLGHESDHADDDKKFVDVLQRLKKEYGIRHNDAECGRNMIAITDSNGEERVVAIDFEDWDQVQIDSQ